MSSSLFEIPKHWKWVTLDDIGIVVSGGTPSTKEPEFWNGDIPWITPADLSNHNEVYISKGNRNISQVGLEYSSAYLLPANSVVFSSRAPIGYVAITKNELATNQGFKNLILPSELVNPKYVYYYLKTVKELAENMASGTTFLELSATKFRQIPFPLAPIGEQNKIVEKIEELLSQADYSLKKLESNKLKLINLKRLRISKIYNEYCQEKLKLNEIFHCIDGDRGKNYPKNNEIIDNGYCLFLNTKNVLKGKLDFSQTKYITKEKSEVLKRGVVKTNDIVITTRGTIGNVALFDKGVISMFEEIRINSGMLILRLKNKNFNPKYFLQYFLSPKFIKDTKDNTTGTAQPQLPSNILKTINLSIFNNLEQQEKIIQEIDSINEDFEKSYFEIERVILQINILKNKIIQEAYQGKLSNQLSTDTSINTMLKNIEKEKIEYLKNQQEKIKNRPKIKRMEKEKLSIIQVLEKNKKPISAKQLWEDSLYNDNIEKFYSELKKVQDKIIEKKTEKGSLISLR